MREAQGYLAHAASSDFIFIFLGRGSRQHMVEQSTLAAHAVQ
jgi:hypothetical protein